MFQIPPAEIPAPHRATEKRLRPRWIKLCNELNIDSQRTQPIYFDLVQHYSCSLRAYHDLQHVEDVLNAADFMQAEIVDGLALKLAIWFHDVIYETDGTTDNERLSADYVVAQMGKLGVSAETLSKAHALIMDTKHQGKPDSQDGCVIVDADLSTFAVARDKFNQHSADLRREFKHIDPDYYCTSRASFLRAMLDRPQFYYTKTMREAHQATARANLRHAIGQLERGDLTFTSN